jgi:hypothetical protein
MVNQWANFTISLFPRRGKDMTERKSNNEREFRL